MKFIKALVYMMSAAMLTVILMGSDCKHKPHAIVNHQPIPVSEDAIAKNVTAQPKR